MIGGEDGHARLVEERLDVESALVDRRPDQRDVGVAVADAAARVVEAHVLDAHLCAGDVRGERAQRDRREVERRRRQQTDTQSPGASERGVARELDRVGHAVEQHARALEQRLARRGQRDPPRRSLDELHAHPLLQLTDVDAERRLGEVEALGRAREVALLRDRDERPQVLELDVHAGNS